MLVVSGAKVGGRYGVTHATFARQAAWARELLLAPCRAVGDPGASGVRLHDIGAVSIGLGVVIVFALARMSALRSTLLGVGVGSLFHVASHVIDYNQKPDPADVAGLSLVSPLTLAAAFGFDR